MSNLKLKLLQTESYENALYRLQSCVNIHSPVGCHGAQIVFETHIHKPSPEAYHQLVLTMLCSEIATFIIEIR